MVPLPKSIAVAAVVTLLLLSSSPADAGTYRDADHHFDFALFDNWTKWPSETLTAANRFAAMRSPLRKIEYAAGFQPRGTPPGSYPYMLVQIHKHSANASYEEIERGIASSVGKATREVQGALGDMVKKFDLDSALLDRANNRVVIRYQLTAPGVGKIDGISMANIGKDAIVTLHYYDHASKFEQSVKSFMIIANSFEFEKEHRFKAAPPSPFRSGSTQLTMIAGLGAFAVIAVAMVLWQARGSKSHGSDWSSIPPPPREPW